MQTIVHKFLPSGLNGILRALPPQTEYYFSIFVNVNLTPGYLSLIAISK